MASSFPGARKWWRSATPVLILYCLIVLFGSPARGQWEPDDRFASQDTVEIRVSRWTALRGGVAEGLALSNTFTIGAAGTLDLPIIGQVPAAGLRASELEQLITDRLQARSGFHQRPITTVTTVHKHPSMDESASANRSSAAASERVHVEGRPPKAQLNATRSHAQAEPVATEQQQALERERSRANALLRDLTAARIEAEAAREELLVGRKAARYQALRYGQLLTAERQSTATLTRELGSVRADLETMKAQLARETKAALHVREAAEARADKERELAVRERAKGAALEQDLLAVRREIDALKNSMQSRGEREEDLRHKLAAARQQLDAMRQAAQVASTQARAVAKTTAEQKRVSEEQRQRAEGLAGDLRLAKREVEILKTKAALSISESAAVHRARHAAEAALAETTRALDEERDKVGLYERDLALARQSIDALEARAKPATAALAKVQAAESAAKQAAEALAVERDRTESMAGALDAARRDRDEAKEELSRVSAAARKSLEEERDRVSALGRDLTEEHRDIDSVKARAARRTIDNRLKARASDRKTPGASPPARTGERQVKFRKPLRTVKLTRMVLPDALLPTKPPIGGSGS